MPWTTRNPKPGEDVAVYCWCQRDIVYVPLELVGRATDTCGRPDCQPTRK